MVAMPPGLTITGRDEIGRFLAASVFVDGLRIRLWPTRANDGPAFVIYSSAGREEPFRPYAVLLVEADGSAIATMRVYSDPRLVSRFEPPARLLD